MDATRNISCTFELKKAFDLYQRSKNINLTKSYGNDFDDYDVIMTVLPLWQEWKDRKRNISCTFELKKAFDLYINKVKMST